MHRRLTSRVTLTSGLVVAALLIVAGPAAAAPVCNPLQQLCNVDTGSGGSAGSSGGGGSARSSGGNTGGTPGCALADGTAMACTSMFGTWSNSLQCYLQLVSPPPPLSDPVWGGHTTGAIYTCATSFSPGRRAVWLPGAPPGAPTPGQLAQQALATVHLPNPVGHRSPTEDNNDHGTPYTWVNLWTWFWADPTVWRPLSARADAGGAWAQVTVTPTRLVITPGEGSADVVCDGPGRAWTQADGNAAPTGGGCGYVYRHVSATPVTATVAIDWTVTWTGSGGTGGTLPTMRTRTSSSFAIEQIQIVTR